MLGKVLPKANACTNIFQIFVIKGFHDTYKHKKRLDDDNIDLWWISQNQRWQRVELDENWEFWPKLQPKTFTNIVLYTIPNYLYKLDLIRKSSESTVLNHLLSIIHQKFGNDENFLNWTLMYKFCHLIMDFILWSVKLPQFYLHFSHKQDSFSISWSGMMIWIQ